MPDISGIFPLHSPFQFAGQQLRCPPDDGKGRAQVMGDSQHHAFSGLYQFPVLLIRDFQLSLVAVPPVQLPMYDGIKENSQQ